MTILSILATVFGTIMAFGSLPQIYKIFRRKSAKDISAISYSIYALGGIVWLLYGLELESFAVILSNSLSTSTSLIVLLGWFIYGRKKR
jgi:MtN3 and saliva related transmembrane protein